jgi:hypothetical protein
LILPYWFDHPTSEHPTWCGRLILSEQSLLVMGNLKPYHVRVSIDEEDIPRLKLNAPATAMLRCDLRRHEVPMTFVRIEPEVIPRAIASNCRDYTQGVYKINGVD